MIRGAVFDIDGTLLDSMPVWEHAGERYVRSRGKTPETGLAERLFPMSLEESAVYLKEQYALKQSPEEILEGIDAVIAGFYEKEVPLKQGAAEFLKELQDRHIPMAAATSGRGALAEKAFERLGIRSCFKRIITCTEIGKGKNEPDIFLAAAEVIKAAPEEIWVFEDTLHAVQTAAHAGFRTVGVFDEASSGQTEEIQKTADIFLYHLKDFEAFWKKASR